MNPLSLAGLGLGLIGGFANIFGAGSANNRLEQLIKQDPTYQANPIAPQRLGLATQLLNARMPGATQAERNIYGAQSNQEANIQRNATSGSQAIAEGAAGQATTNASFDKLSQEEAADYQRRYGNYTQAQQGVIDEQTKAYQDQVRRFEDMAQIRGAQNQNKQAAWSSLSNAGFGLANFGLSKGLTPMLSPGYYGNSYGQPNVPSFGGGYQATGQPLY